MNFYREELNNFSYPMHRDDLYAKTDEEFIEINQRDQFDIERTQRNFEKLANGRIELEKSWSSFISRIRGFDGFLRVTDRTPTAFVYSFKVEIVLDNNLGLGFCLSQIGKLIGIYFTSQKTSGLIPLKEFTSSIGEYSKESINPFISYFPYSEIQIEKAQQLMELSKVFYPDYVLFNNLFASVAIEDLVIYDKNIYKSELFKVLFADNLVVI
ncbi:hypothetical protein [uncultured Algoriphagus sp.]|uniref:hypothetical protein n=1 Tax=uncultured Algoriphagus sp. TaxID=417365 RepID=UPI0030ED2E62